MFKDELENFFTGYIFLEIYVKAGAASLCSSGSIKLGASCGSGSKML
jgi:hypothetical protein